MGAEVYDLIIIGTGPAGLTAALYGVRLGLRTVAFGDVPGGTTNMIEKIDNYPGFPDGISGTQFGVFTLQQAQQQGANFTMSRVKELAGGDGRFSACDVKGQEYSAPSVIVATGRVPRRLAIPNASLPGIHFCSLCDGPLYRDKKATLAVVGDDNSAAQHSLTLARIADKVLLISKKKQLGMDEAHKKQLAGHANIEILTATEVIGYEGEKRVEGITVKKGDGGKTSIPVNGVFLVIGWRPNTKMLVLPVDFTAEGYIRVDANLMSSSSGLFAAGDVRDTDVRQVLTSCADGARAAKYVAEFLERQKAG